MSDGVVINQGVGGKTIYTETDPATGMEIQGVKILVGTQDANTGPVNVNNPMPVTDAMNAPFTAPVVVAVGGTFTACRAIGFLVTTAGFAVVTFPNGTVFNLPVEPGGMCQFNYAGCTLTSMSATGTAYALN